MVDCAHRDISASARRTADIRERFSSRAVHLQLVLSFISFLHEPRITGSLV